MPKPIPVIEVKRTCEKGEKIPRKGGPGIMRSDLLIINKIDLAPHVGASLVVMKEDTERMRGDRPYVMSNLMSGEGLDHIVHWIEHQIGAPHEHNHTDTGFHTHAHG